MQRKSGAAPRFDGGFAIRLLRWIVIIFAAGIPLFVSPGEDWFRFPKEIAIRVEVILLGSVIALALLAKSAGHWQRPSRSVLGLAGLVIAWTALTSLTATNRIVAFSSLVWVLSCMFLYLTSIVALRKAGMWALTLPLAAAVLNGITVILQDRNIWSPFLVRVEHDYLRRTGFVGNPNDVGGYLALCTVAAFAMAVAAKGRHRLLAGSAAGLLAFAVIATHTVTAIIALVSGVLVAGALRSKRTFGAAILVAVTALMVGIVVYQPLRTRFETMRAAYKERNYDALFSYRSAAFTAAILMARDHPLVGVGPGCFGWMYYDYRLLAEKKFPDLIQSGAREFNFAEVHSDHLQVLAQTGLPGYLLFVMAILYVASVSFSKLPSGDERQRFARALGVPLATAFAVLAIAQFPLELAAPSHTAFYFAALAEAWRDGA